MPSRASRGAPRPYTLLLHEGLVVGALNILGLLIGLLARALPGKKSEFVILGITSNLDNPNLRRADRTQFRYVLYHLAWRALELKSPHGPPVPPQVEAGPEAWREWFDLWRDRVKSWRNLLARWKKTKGPARKDILIRLGDTGHPEFLGFHLGLSREKAEGLGTAHGEALIRYARKVGYPEEKLPAAGAGFNAMRGLGYALGSWLSYRGGWQ